MNGQMERHGTVTTVNVVERLGVTARLVIGRAVPSVADTCCVVECGCTGLINGQMQGYKTVAMVDVEEILTIIA